MLCLQLATKMFRLVAIVFVSAVFSHYVNGQNPTCFSQADTFYVAPQAQIHVFGNVVIGNSTLIQDGFLQTYNSVQPGDFILQDSAEVISKGMYKIEQDWINDGILRIDSGIVEMYGPNQWFKGDSISTFFDLLLTGSAKKEQEQHIRVKNQLNITNKELAVHQKHLYLDNSDPANLIYDPTFGNEGIISTDEDGIIYKYIAQNQINRIPVGSYANQFMHRPLVATLTNASSDTLHVTYHQHTPDLINAFSTNLDSLCRVQTTYFYTINSAESNAHFDLGFATFPPVDGNFPDPSYWTGQYWKPILNDYDVQESNYIIYHAPDEHDFLEEHYSLGHRTPPAPVLLVDTTACYQLSDATVESPVNMPFYQWSVLNYDHSAAISGQVTNQIEIDWGNHIGGQIEVIYQDDDACWSFPTEATIYDVSVHAEFTSSHDNSIGFDTPFTFNNLSSPNTDIFEWILPDNEITMSNSGSLNYTFTTNGEAIQYTVMLIATDQEFGCIDTAYQDIIVPNIFVIYAPNSFTPNGDGINDAFFIEASDIISLNLRIYNRWGEQIYNGEATTNSHDASWDGTYLGELVPSGTYTYVAEISPKNYNQSELSKKVYSGHIVVLR